MKKVEWLERIFSEDAETRKKAMDESYLCPDFESEEELDKVLDELEKRRKNNDVRR